MTTEITQMPKTTRQRLNEVVGSIHVPVYTVALTLIALALTNNLCQV